MHKEKIPRSRQAIKGEEKVESFIFYESFYRTFLALGKQNLKNSKELQIQLLEKIFEVGFFGESGKKHSMIEMLFLNIEPIILKSRMRYAANRKNGKKGGRPRTPPSIDEIAAIAAKKSQQKHLKKHGITKNN